MGKHAFSPTDTLSELSSVSATTLVVRVDREMLFEGCGDGATARAARPAPTSRRLAGTAAVC